MERKQRNDLKVELSGLWFAPRILQSLVANNDIITSESDFY